MTTLCARGISVRYGTRDVLDDVTLSLDAGEAVAIVGPNGAGKSTLLRCLSGVLTPTRGGVTLDGRALSGYRPGAAARVIAVVPQVADVFFPFTVREVVALGRTPWLGTLGRASPADDRIVDDALARCDLLPLEDQRLDRVSGGERQRALLAMAVAQRPRALLLDEPTTHLDPAHQRATLSFARDSALRQGLLVVAILHDLNLAAAFATRTVILSRGRVVSDGRMTEETLRSVFGGGLRVIEDGVRRVIAHDPL
ncbi:MAG: ABC transporter ATP-binding protein [Chloroflexi bacterium]|nr:ABC transporter ATP-binding protein [Chloroflexota bacterium]